MPASTNKTGLLLLDGFLPAPLGKSKLYEVSIDILIAELATLIQRRISSPGLKLIFKYL